MEEVKVMKIKDNIPFSFILFTMLSLLVSANAQYLDSTRIKTQSLWQYDIVGGVPEKSGSPVSLTRYNLEGQAIEQKSYDPDGKLSEDISLTYHQSGQLKESLTKSSVERDNHKSVYAYKNNLLVGVDIYNPDGSLKVQIDYKYDDGGNLLEIVTHDPDNRMYVKQINTYGTDEKLLESVIQDKTGKIIIRKKYNYDADGYTVEVFGGMQKTVMTNKEIYDKKGNLTKQIVFNEEGEIVSSTTNEYDKQGNIIKVVQEIPSAQIKTRTNSKYDDSNLVEQIFYNKLDEPVKVIRAFYEYF